MGSHWGQKLESFVRVVEPYLVECLDHRVLEPPVVLLSRNCFAPSSRDKFIDILAYIHCLYCV